MKISLEKQRSWDEKKLAELCHLGVEGFTITDLPFSSVVQAYWFLGAVVGEIFFGKFVWWQDTDSHFFYKNTLGKKSIFQSLNIFWKLHQRLLDHHNLYQELLYTPKAIATLAANGKFKKTLQEKIDKIVLAPAPEGVGPGRGIFFVSGGGILQRFFRNFFPFNIFLNSSYELFSYTRNKYPHQKLFAAANPNTKQEDVKRLLKKHHNFVTKKYNNVDVILTQPPFIWSRFEKYLQEISENEHTKNIQIRVGVPVFTNAWNVRFWMQLVSVNWKKEEEAKELVRLFDEKYFQDKTEKKQEFKEFSKNWTIGFIGKIQALQSKFPQISGIHIMPMGNSISVEDIILSISQEKTASTVEAPTKIKYENIKYKNHFYEMNESLREKMNSENKIYLENDFVPQHKSIIWYFNKLFWDQLDQFMQAVGKDYKKSIGGTADSNTQLTKYSAEQFADQVKNSNFSNISYVELGAASCDWAKEFITEYRKIEPHKKFTYIFTDFSNEVLQKAKSEMGENFQGIEMQYLLSDKPIFSKILRIHATNIYDNYPHDRFLWDKGNLYQTYLKTYISKDNLETLAGKYVDQTGTKEKIISLVANFTKNTKKYQNNVENFLNHLKKILPQNSFYIFWQEFWNCIKFEEKYIPATSNTKIEKIFENLKNEKIEFSVSIETERDILKKINMLATGGCLEIIDIIANKSEDYKNFLGPVKYDGSLANYLNGPLLKSTILEKYTNISVKEKSLKDFGGKRNQTILEIIKN